MADSTCGSGGLAVSARNLKRNWIINDNDPYWCEISRLRLVEEWDKNLPKKKELKERLKNLRNSFVK